LPGGPWIPWRPVPTPLSKMTSSSSRPGRTCSDWSGTRRERQQIQPRLLLEPVGGGRGGEARAGAGAADG
jgi:hypothetical protein